MHLFCYVCFPVVAYWFPLIFIFDIIAIMETSVCMELRSIKSENAKSGTEPWFAAADMSRNSMCLQNGHAADTG
jgi:hypothetical protein